MFSKYGSLIKKSNTNSINIQTTKIDKKFEQKNSKTKNLSNLNFGMKSNSVKSERKISQDEMGTSRALSKYHLNKETSIVQDNSHPTKETSHVQEKPHPVKEKKCNLDEPSPETVGQYYEERKKIIFKNYIEDDSFIKNFILKTQLYMNKQYKMKSNSFFGEKAVDIYNKVLNFKETIANYSLIIHLYLAKNEFQKSFELFLLMSEQNKMIVDYFYRKIQDQLPKITNSNRIGKFFPSITKIFIQLLSCLIKLSCKFCKSKLENYYVNYYLKTIDVVSKTVIAKFGGITDSNNMDNDIKQIGRYFYSNFIFDVSIFFFLKYEPLLVCIFILQHILDLYQDKSFIELIDIEHVLLIKVNYNLGLFLYVEGYNIEAISNLNQAKNRLCEIKFLPLNKEKKNKQFRSGNSSEHLPIMAKLTYNYKDFDNNLVNETIKKSSSKNIFEVKNDKKKNTVKNKDINDISFLGFSRNIINNNLRISLNSKLDLKNKQSNSNNKKQYTIASEAELIKDNLRRKSSGVLFGNQIMSLQLECENIEEKIYNEIELILSEIELSQKNYKEALRHLKKLLPSNLGDSNPFNIYRNNLNFRSKIMEEKSKIKKNEQIGEPNYCNFYLLSDGDKRKMMIFMDKIEHAFDDNNNYDDNSCLDNEANEKSTNNNKKIDGKKLINSKEMEKFFLFICSLSVYQLKILNESQPKPSDKRNDLPIIFSNQFQDCLTNAQRMTLGNLESLSLSRYIILKNTNKDISPNNLDFRFMKYRIKDTEPEIEKEYNKIFVKDKKNIFSRNIENNNTREFSTINYLLSNTGSSQRNNKIHN